MRRSPTPASSIAPRAGRTPGIDSITLAWGRWDRYLTVMCSIVGEAFWGGGSVGGRC